MKKKPKHKSHYIEPRKKRVHKDTIHWSCRKMDSYNKPFNLVVSAREPGKSTVLNGKLVKKFIHKHKRFLILRRRPVDITEGYINSICTTINKFLPVHKRIMFYFKKGDCSTGQVDLYLKEDMEPNSLIGRVQALNIPSARAKSNLIPDVATILYDEFISNNTNDYLKDEILKFKEIYSTYYRENDTMLKCYFSGNPYSLFNPFFSYLGIDILKVKPGCFLVGKNYVLEFPVITEELREYILSRNPIYEFDDEYKEYALNGLAINDTKYKIEPRPHNWKLKWIFRVSGYYVLYWRNNNNMNMITDKYWVEATKVEPTTNKTIYSVDFDNLIQNTNLVNMDIKVCTMALKEAISRRLISFGDINAAVLTESIYKVI